MDTPDACIISFDRPGVGESALSEYYSMEEFLGNVYKILKQHNVVSVNVIGHSAGGYYAQVFSHLYPDFVKTLSLLSSMVPLNCSKTKSIVKGQWKFINLLSLKAKNLSKFYFKMMRDFDIDDISGTEDIVEISIEGAQHGRLDNCS